jgi:RNA polymerase sigma factor (sigma-70 family)
MNTTEYNKLKAKARYFCFLYDRPELCDDIQQDLSEDFLHGISPGSRLMSKRAISHILSKKYNRQYGGLKKTQYTFLDWFECGKARTNEPIQRKDDSVFVDQLLSCLSDKRRAFVTLWMNGYTHEEIADIYETTRSNVSHLINRAIKQMRQKVGDNNGISRT